MYILPSGPSHHSAFPIPSLAGIYFKDVIRRDWYGSRNRDVSQWVGGARAEWGDVRGVRQYKSQSCQWNAQKPQTERTEIPITHLLEVVFSSRVLASPSVKYRQEGYKESNFKSFTTGRPGGLQASPNISEAERPTLAIQTHGCTSDGDGGLRRSTRTHLGICHGGVSPAATCPQVSGSGPKPFPAAPRRPLQDPAGDFCRDRRSGGGRGFASRGRKGETVLPSVAGEPQEKHTDFAPRRIHAELPHHVCTG